MGFALLVGVDLFVTTPNHMLKPPTQVELSEKDRKDEVTRVLTASDPNIPNNVTKYNYKEKVFKVDPPGAGEELCIHFEMNGCVIHRESQEAKEQAAYNQQQKEAHEDALKAAAMAAAEAGEDPVGEEDDVS